MGRGTVSDVEGVLCDSWSALDLSPSFAARSREPWFVRPAGPAPAEDDPPELEIVRVSTPDEVVEFEAVSLRGFGADVTSLRPGTIHPATILRDERMTMLTGRVGGAAVAAAMSFADDGAVGVFGVTTVVSVRGRGYASALTRALVSAQLPTVLSPSREAERLYRRLGFAEVGALQQWERRG